MPTYAKRCAHCGRAVRRSHFKYGSNACRQAAYRKRCRERYTTPASRNVTSRPTAAAIAIAPLKESSPPSAEKTPAAAKLNTRERPGFLRKGGAA